METYEKGVAQLVAMLGEEGAGEIARKFYDLSPAFEREAVSVVFGRTWSRDQIDLKTRSLCSICILASLGRINALKINFTLAIQNGATKEEIVEVLLQVAVYAGYPAALDALATFKEVIGDSNT
ncbi:MAG: carboxymuconolactone decarboxylase family protein [Candidatus Thiodiazotropha sp. (ex Monitilora ramsayi)]|nr:carboxymuconolactone decarboxylase family protein [Candidatus Thiodiazotropha sp. (ex Monitilora ramsayi)]